MAEVLVAAIPVIIAAVTSSTVLTAIVVTAVSVGVGLLIASLIPVPSLPSSLQSQQQQSPNNTLTAQRNQARLTQPIPVIYGRRRVFPDLITQPYQEFTNDEQIIFEIFAVGQGEFEFETLKIGDSPISAFQDVSYEFYGPGVKPSLFPNNMFTSDQIQNLELKAPNDAPVADLQQGEEFGITFDVPNKKILSSHNRLGSLQVGDVIILGGAGRNDRMFTVASVAVDGSDITVQESLSAYTLVEATVSFNSSTNTVTGPAGTFSAFAPGDYMQVWPNSLDNQNYDDWLAVNISADGSQMQLISGREMIDETNVFRGFEPRVVDDVSVALASSIVAGPAPAAPAGQAADELAIDILFPQGLFSITDRGALGNNLAVVNAEYRAIDDDGNPSGSWTTFITKGIVGGDQDPLRRTYKLAVTPGRYEVRVWRTFLGNRGLFARSSAPRHTDSTAWVGLRGKLPDTSEFVSITTLAVRVRATNQLSNESAKQINVVAKRKLRAWNGSGWSSPQVTSSIAWSFADAAQASYGGKLSDSNLDLAKLLALDAVWAARGDEFNGVFDTSETIWESLKTIARSGRAVPIYDGTILSVSRDQSQTLRTGLFNHRNILKGSLQVEFNFPEEDSPDAVIGEYIDAATWKPAEVKASVDGTSSNPTRVQLFGITDPDQAFREAVYIAADNRFRRRRIRFTTEMEGFIPQFGDLVTVVSDFTAWGAGGEVTSASADQKTLTVSEPLPWEAGEDQHRIRLRRPDGSVTDEIVVARGDSDDEMVLSQAPDFPLETDGSTRERTYFQFGAPTNTPLDCRVISIRPRDEFTVEIECVNEDERVHTAEDDYGPIEA